MDNQWTWINPRCNSLQPNWEDRVIAPDLRPVRQYTQTFNVSETFPVVFGEEWNVIQYGKFVEHWKVVDKEQHKNTVYFTALIDEYLEDENRAVY